MPNKAEAASSSAEAAVLLVDDNAANLLALEAVLEPLNCRLIRASSGMEALRFSEAQDFAVILLDVQMAGLDGFETAARLKRHPRSSLTPIIFLTAASHSPHFVFKGYEHGAVDYISKPFDTRILRSKVRVFVELYLAQEKIRRQGDLLRQQEALAQETEHARQFQVLANSMPQLAWIAEPNGDVLWFNDRWYEYTGTTPEQMKEDGGTVWKRVHDPKELSRVVARFQEAIASGEPWEDTFLLRRHDGEFRWHLSRAMPVRNAAGKITRWFGTNTDVDEQRRQAAALHEAVATRDTFLSIASHELKTPLTPLSIRLGALERQLDEQPDTPFVEVVRSYVDSGRKQLRRLNHLVNDLLDVSRTSAGQLTVELERVEVGRLVKEVASRFEAEATQAGSTLRVTAENPVALCDPLRMEQVVSNLLANAIKYGAGHPIRVTLKSVGACVELSVQDSGIGIPEDAHQRIFNRFERAVSARNYGGWGLGLYIARTIVEAMNGTIAVESAPGQGATFTVKLPVQPEVRP